MEDKAPIINKSSIILRCIDRVEDSIEVFKISYAKAIRLVHGRQFLAEFLATFILMTFGNGSVAQFILSHHEYGTFLTVNIGYAIGLMIGAYVAGGVSGAHMNPAVTLAMALRGNISMLMVLPYWIAQFIGAFLSSVVVYGVYFDAITTFDGMRSDGTRISNCFVNDTVLNPKLPLCTGGIFATYPQEFLSLPNGFLDQVLSTLFLVLGIFAICDSKNSEVKAGLKPLMIGFLLWGIGVSFGFNCGYAINPARDFAPRVFTAIAGWGKDVFICSQCPFHHWWWVPILAPLLGGAIAAPLYWFLIEANHPSDIEEEEEEEEEEDSLKVEYNDAKVMDK